MYNPYGHMVVHEAKYVGNKKMNFEHKIPIFNLEEKT